MKKVVSILGFGLLLSTAVFARSQTTMPLSTILQNAMDLGYHSIFEAKLSHGIYKLEGLDQHQQEVDILLNAMTGQLVPASEQIPQRTALDVAKALEKQGYQVLKLELESSGYYEVHVLGAHGQAQKLKIPANEQSPMTAK